MPESGALNAVWPQDVQALLGAVQRVLAAYETGVKPGELAKSDLWPALAELREVYEGVIEA